MHISAHKAQDVDLMVTAWMPYLYTNMQHANMITNSDLHELTYILLSDVDTSGVVCLSVLHRDRDNVISMLNTEDPTPRREATRLCMYIPSVESGAV